MGLPAIRVRDFPGNREEANRAGITPSNLFGTIDLITGGGAAGKNSYWPRMNANERGYTRSTGPLDYQGAGVIRVHSRPKNALPLEPDDL
jgi:hypothetical protein